MIGLLKKTGGKGIESLPDGKTKHCPHYKDEFVIEV
jgi:hypothetical protein